VLLSVYLQLLALANRGFKPRQHKVHDLDADEAHKLWYWIDDHGDVVFPLIGLAIVALVIVGIRRGMKSNVAELHEKQEQKDAIVRMMRAKLLVSPEAVAGELQIDHFKASALLEELVKEGKLVQQRVTGGIANYRLKGL
jgi:hypothetical protein